MAAGVLAVLAVAVLAARPLVPSLFGEADGKRYAHLVTDFAYRGPFLVTVSIQGNLDSQKNVTVNSSVEGTTTIISIVPEGTLVEKGDVVCVLDSSALQDNADQQEIVVTNADAAEVQARQDYEVQKTQNESDIAAAELQLLLAELDLEKYEQGELLKLESELKGNKAIAEEEAIQAKENHEFNKQQVKKGYISQNDLEASRILLERKDLDVIKATQELKVLVEYDSKRQKAELNANAQEFVRELERVKLKANSAEIQALQAYEAAKKSAELERNKLNKLLAQVANCTLKAPQSGEVVYANLSSRSRRGGDGPAIEEGASVYERQAIFNLPDISKMKVDARVHESLIGNLRVGLPAKIEVAGKHDTAFHGEVAHVSSVPSTGSWPNYDLREYPVTINITDDSKKVEEHLKPGLTAQVEIFVDSRDDVLQVPVQAVIGVVGKYFAFVLKPDGPERRELSIGQSNDTAVEILDGVAEGDKVVLNPRTNFADEIAELTNQLAADANAQDATENQTDDVPAGPPLGESPGGASPGAGPPPGGGRPGAAAGGERPAGGGGFDPSQMFTRMDADKDGKLSGDEIPTQMQSRLSDIDKDGDGAISQAEMSAMMQQFRGGGGGGAPGAGGARPDGGRPGAGAGGPGD